MPWRDYKCPKCGHVYVDIPDKDTVWCVCQTPSVECERLPAAPSFKVTGYNAQNGYSK